MIWNQRVAVAPERPHNSLGDPRFGTYEGSLDSTDLKEVAHRAGLSAIHKIRSEKRWQWFSAIGPQVAVGAALIRTGYVGQLFVWVFDREKKRMIKDLSMTLPLPLVSISDTPGHGCVASFRALGQYFELIRDVHGVDVRVRFRGVDLSLRFQSSRIPPMTAVCPVANDRVNITQKQAGMLVEGVVRAGNKTFSLQSDNSFGFLDYSHGLLAYETSWLWAIGAGTTKDGRPISFNLCDRFNEGLENVVWLDGHLYHVGSVTFRYNPDNPNEPWNVQCMDGSLDLTLNVEGVRQENVNLGLIRSEYSQPLGTWSGNIGSEIIVDAVGVAEDHFARW